ncbi:putative kelch-containing protein 4 [Coleophoma cylindrospora]|uniref:Putative kelch-containing protein 4 n=1 Tax=Coleophoma cylindrospora TaxID=1849047 RepID=A0A3D8SFB6_9HELO|nr:putative kelch-containing protein 4 [Coleophoma cylindrospora]
MAKDKKGKSDSKKAKLAEKKQKQASKGEKKEKVKASKANESDAEDVDLDAVLAEYAKQQEQFLKVTEAPCEPPKPRASSTIIASPANSNELFVFGGEYFNGALATFFNDLYVYLIDRDEWRLITSPNSPLPRSGHAWCRGGNAGGIYLFGGEFSSPKQGTFYHYNDFWRFEPSSREWTRVETKGKTPPARSGHRMTYFKNYIILFGGFQDTSQTTKYLADLWVYDTQNFTWHNPALPLANQKPDPRSSFSFLPHESGAVLYGGYSRVKTTVTGKQTKGGGQSQRNILKPMVHQDCFFLKITQPATDAAPNTPPTVRWERRKKPANIPTPLRAGATMAYHKGRGISFGGVHDVEESEEGIDSEFFNQLFAWNIERNRYFPLSLRKPRTTQRKAQGNERGGRRGRGQANEEELLRNLAALETGKSIADADDMELDKPKEESDEKPLATKEILMEFPHPRFNAQLAVQDDVLYIFGGTYEKGDREYTFDEMYAVDLGKLDGVKQIYHRELDNWLGSEDEDSEDDEDEDEEDNDDEEDDEGDVEMVVEKRPHTESTRKSRRKDKESSEPAASSTLDDTAAIVSPTFDDTPEDTSTTPDDNLPHPRPFESRRDFFQRTGNEWQEALMTSLRWKGIQPESLAVKEIKTRAFEMSEEKWWDCREEITALEDEQDAAGIGEVVALADRGETTSGPGRRR